MQQAEIDAATGAPVRKLPFLPPRPRVEVRPDGSVLMWDERPPVPFERSIAHLFVKRAREFPGRVLVAERAGDDWRRTTYGEMLDRAARIASGLASRGLKPGDVLVILSGESIDHVALTLGAALARVVTLPVSVGYSLSSDRQRLAHVLKLTRPVMAFAKDGAAFAAALDDAKAAGCQVLTGGEGAGTLGELESGSPADIDALLELIDADTHYKILLTSGSTSMPRAVIQTHGMNCAAAASEEGTFSWPHGPREEEAWVDWLPWAHVGGSMTTFSLALYAGASIYLDDGRPIPGRFDASIRNLSAFPPLTYGGAPSGYVMLVEAMERDPAFRERFFSRLSHTKSGSAAMPEEVRRHFQQLSIAQTGEVTPMVMGYGTTETHGTFILHWHDPVPNRLGWPKPGVLVKLAPTGPVYEIRIKAPSVTPGYFNDPEATAAAFDEEGFFRTGDSVTFDPARPGEYPVFAGRLGENFKLATGTWVPVAEVRSHVMDVLDLAIEDCMPVGEGETELGLMVWASEDAATRQTIVERLHAYNRTAGGGSRRIGRVLFSHLPLSPERFEKTEKGTLNRAIIIRNRPEEMAMLYADAADQDGRVIIL